MLLESVFADGKKLADFTPWLERDGVEQDISRELPASFKNLLNALASRYELRYLSIPVALQVRMDTDLGKSGGFTWKILWTLWDARYGELSWCIRNLLPKRRVAWRLKKNGRNRLRPACGKCFRQI